MATGGGGYQWAAVVPRAWTIYFAEMAGVEVPDHIPEAWMEIAEREAGSAVPETLSEPPLPTSGRDEAVNEVVAAVKHTIWPYHGL